MFKKPFKASPQREVDDSSSSSFFSSPTTPKKGKNKQNPYAMGGRDKFATILADLDRKRRTIYEELGTQDISKVRFGYVDSQKWVPIVVRTSKDHHQDEKTKSVSTKDKHLVPNTQKVGKEVKQSRDDVEGKIGKKMLHASVNYLSKHIQASGDFSIVLVLVLCCLDGYMRVFAVICICIWWLLVPIMKNNEVNLKELVKRRDDERVGEKKMAGDVITSTKTKISDVIALPKREILSQGPNWRMPSSPTPGFLSKISSPKTNLPALSPKASPKRENLSPPLSPKRENLSPLLLPKDYFGRTPSPKRDYSGSPLTPKRSYFSPALSPKRASVMSSPTSPPRTPNPGLSPRHIRAYNKSW